MSSVNTAIQLITREQAASSAKRPAAASTCSPALARGPWDYDLAEALGARGLELVRDEDGGTIPALTVSLYAPGGSVEGVGLGSD